MASGGNAGLAAACAANALKAHCTVYLPRGASASTLAFFEQERAEVIQHGACYQEALDAAEKAVAEDSNAYVFQYRAQMLEGD